MPKVVSRSAVSSSTDAPSTASSAANLRVYYCICGEFILVIDKSLNGLPKRQTDGSTIIRASGDNAHVFKLNAVPVAPILLERRGGHERQHRLACPRCTLPIGYHSTNEPPNYGPFVYILPGSLTQMQGEIPSDAFEGENNNG